MVEARKKLTRFGQGDVTMMVNRIVTNIAATCD
jgi:hypothetical protein